jgi:DNA-binding beta-propeller fold protein YncE
MPNGKTAYVADYTYTRGTVTPITTATNTAGPPIPAGSNPWTIAITPTAKPPTSHGRPPLTLDE